MKKNPDKTYQPTIGRDELNMIECPFTLLTDSAEDRQKTLEFTDKQNGLIRHWTITGSDKYGLLCAMDEPVFIAMLALTKREELKNQKVYFNPYELLKLMRWPISGQRYDRLELALSRLVGVTIYTDYLWDNGEFTRPIKAIGFHILEEFEVEKGVKAHKNSWFKWGDRIFESFIHGNLKNLNLETYFSLKTPISKRFYRLWDKRLYKTDHTSFDLKDLCHEKLGISRNLIYPSLLKQALRSALREHKAKKLLSSAIYVKSKDGNWLLNIKRYRETPEPLPAIPPGSAEDSKENPLLEKLLLLKIPTNKAKILLQIHPRELIEGWIMAVDIVKPVPRNRAGYLVQALRENWELPEEVRKKKDEEKREQEERLKIEYEKYIFIQVDEHLKKMDPEQIAREIKAHREIFFSRLPAYFREDLGESESVKRQIEHDYKKAKGESLGLPSFEDWRSKET